MAVQTDKIKILVIDDSDIILVALRNFFEGYDFEVYTCLDGLTGIQLCSELKPDLIFLDLMMPNFDGIRFLQVKNVLREIKEIPVIVISANTNKRNVLSAIELGANRVISKPLQKDIIIKTLKEVLSGTAHAIHNTKETQNEVSDHFKDTVQQNLNLEIRAHLRKVFLENFKTWKNNIEESLKNRDKKVLDDNLHEIKGAGGTIGYNDVSEMVREIEERIIKSDLDWFFIQVRWEQILKIIKDIEDSLTVNS
jgi:DNA-binding response OmpR family regulator